MASESCTIFLFFETEICILNYTIEGIYCSKYTNILRLKWNWYTKMVRTMQKNSSLIAVIIQ